MRKAIPLAALLLAIGLFASIWMASSAYKQRNRASDSIVVTGLGKKDFKSDLIVWEANFARKDMDLQAAFTALKGDRDAVVAYLESKGVAADEMTLSSVSIDKEFDYRYDNNGRGYSVFTGHALRQRVELQSGDIEKVEAISREITELINQGIEINSPAPQYFYTQLSALKIEMIASATEDARIRAEQIAQNSGASLGRLQSAQMGIFQIIGQHSNEDFSWGGTFNTSSKNKTATITMKLRFGVD